MNSSPSFDQIIEIQNQSIQLQIQHWLKFEIFTYQFWLLIAILIVPWFFWWKLVDKKRFFEIVIFGLLIETAVTFLDEVGCQLNLWEYRFDIEPLFPRLIPINFTVFPITYMLIYQYFPKWKTYLSASFISAVFFTYIAEPFFVYINIYALLNWKHIYSFPVYIFLSVAFKLLMIPIVRIQRRTEP